MHILVQTILTAIQTITAIFTPIFSIGSGGYDNVNRRFLFTITNESPYAFHLEETKQWYGNLETPLRVLEAGDGQEMGILQIRGYKKPDTATGVTYSLCFHVFTEEGQLQQVLNIYLQIGYSSNNYFGWFMSDTPTCLDPDKWYDKTASFNKYKDGCSDTVLNKGGTFRLQATCFGLLRINMYTDNLSLSTPSMSITWAG